MLTHESTIALTLMATSTLMAVLFAYSYSAQRQLYQFFWSLAWGLLALHYAAPIARIWLQDTPWLGSIEIWLVAASVLMLFLSAKLYAHGEPRVYPIVTTAIVLAVWSVAFRSGQTSISPALGISAITFATAWIFWKESRKQEALADRGLSVALIFWGALGAMAAVGARFDPATREVVSALVVVPLLCIAILMSMSLYGDEKRRVESNMLALSNLNLATSGLVGNDVQKMLAQALERILSVVRVPRGALFLHHGDPQGPTCVVAQGLGDSFCTASQQEGLDDHLVSLVVRLGGLAVFNDLHHDADWEALDRDDAFRRFRQLAIAQGLHSVAAISLQAKENAFGVLLLGTIDSRRFSSGELRLLLALGHQIGMAVENSYLVQQTSRRTDELHILNEIGRALSSTLDTNTVFDKIYAEMQRLFDVNNLYIAFYDPERNVLRFEIEVEDGVRVPKRERPAGDHLSEYVIRTRQALLIRENFAESMQRLGIEPVQQRGCFCGVPLVRHDRAIGLIAVHSKQERVYDAGHLELMRVLASEATIALENARLFRDEQTKSRHLTLLNNVSRNAIATLNPDEMLARIAAELELGLTYDHIGIGVLDYADKEIVIQAEAGTRRQALNRRIPLGDGLVGRVARAGEMMVVPNFVSNAGAGAPVLEDSASGAALPIYYSDHLHGVLYVETSQLHTFPNEELQILSTLADLISGALHNALTFQRAQEQAITDGLTGVKTHRFFMETLSSEWKRATRAGRPFSVVLIDLDRFKFVNDFYGHLEGDLVLQRISQILEQTCRRSDVVARYGGDEFVILMPETNVEQARQLASKLRSCICSDPLLHDKNITGSFGIASFPVHGSTPQELIQVADASMYVSKHQGGNAVSSAEHLDPTESKRWKRDVLEGYLNVTLKHPLNTGPDALEDICQRLEQFTRSVADTETASPQTGAEGARMLPPAVSETLTSLVTALDSKDPCTEGHSQKVSSYAAILAKAAGMSEVEIEEVRLAGLLHDIGKVGIPEAVILKSGPLDPTEWDLMQQHVRHGARLLQPFPEIAAIREMVEHHHEFFDGSGYPDGLAEEAISLGARIIALADAYDTITSERSYQRARTAEEAFRVLERCSGAQFDPRLVELFVEALRRRSHPLIDVTPAAVPVATTAS